MSEAKRNQKVKCVALYVARTKLSNYQDPNETKEPYFKKQQLGDHQQNQLTVRSANVINHLVNNEVCIY